MATMQIETLANDFADYGLFTEHGLIESLADRVRITVE